MKTTLRQGVSCSINCVLLAGKSVIIVNFCFKQISLNVCQYFLAILCYKTQKKCLSLTYATDLKCYSITVQFYIALQLEVQELDEVLYS